MSPDREATGLSIADAARRLGVSENAVRQRIKRRSIAAAKVDGVWRVSLPDHAGDHQADREGDRPADHEATIAPAARAQMGAIYDEWLAPLVDRVGALERENGRLEAARDALRAEVARLNAAAEAPPAPDATGAAGEPGPAVRPSVAARRGRTPRTVDLDGSGGLRRRWWDRLAGRG
jgi:predicted ArsR family transcriptional regulator